MMWQEIACKATLGELNALLEWELHHIATIPHFEVKARTNKGKSKLVSDLSVKDVFKLIEKYYELKINEIDSFEGVMEFRKKVNSFKHRKGYKHPIKDNCKTLCEKVELNIKEAFECIDILRKFIKDLWSKTTNKKS
ncbi:MAG: hypothetical protein K8F52_01825 [Candidatus Scalindua rubra]|uniref:Uncharacterized protein n=1 Tax=Candidatus Scalindua brodae TaxID=237368 RepID=A0A0B0ENA6_9BACT|nr:MAG: hypothetical protein SCABRO_02186 [Candidatus Scalindua brodae]MBZ0107381.1 hypothetical protein [Candidatus Scalindua rubra]TWU31422.1 hypothetical protein S225a_20940 [Candidatus Brocadiaceae bacterium S225]